MAEDLMRYDLLAQEALRGVVRASLRKIVKTGLPGEHHFYIAFDTRYPGVRLSERLDGPDHGPGGSIDKILMTWVEQAVGTAALAVAGSHAVVDSDDVALKIYLYSRAQSVMGGTSQIQKNIIAQRILGLPTS